MRHIVCLTFDFDALSGWIARGMTTPTPISRGEVGVVGAERIVELLAQHRILATWFVPGHTLETYPQVCRRIVDAGHEIGHHGWTHRPPAGMSRADEAAELRRGNESILRIAGRHARGYRSPAWDLSPHTIELLLEQDFRYDSSMMAHDYLPYRARQGDVIELEQPARFGSPTTLIEMPISWSLDDYPHFEYDRSRQSVAPGLMNARLVLENWLDDYRYMRSNLDWGVLTYTFHPFVIGRGHRMMALDRLITTLRSEGAEFLTMEDAAQAYAEAAAAEFETNDLS
jgi:peptidoglycan/xylan/chitin deacetylase (PgdA/CDA1 family)